LSGAHGQTVTLTFDSQANAALASKLAEAITNGVKNGAIVPAVDTDGPPPPVPPGKSGEFGQGGQGVATYVSGGARVPGRFGNPGDPTDEAEGQ
jgi:hypothetical protein